MTSPPLSAFREQHKVKFGPPTKATTVDVENYMRDRNDLRDFDLNGKDEKQEINDKLLQIISKGIDDIVFGLKLELGDNFESSNAKAFQISDVLNELKNKIDSNTFGIGRNPIDNSPISDAIQIDIDRNRTHTVNPIKTEFYRQRDIHPNIDSDNIQLQDTHDFKTLDDNYGTLLDPNAQRVVDSRIEQTSDKDKIERRLKNCQNLEFLYLKKHDEIMKIIEFTINLFDKYKYAIKVILFLLKNLVYKEPGSDTSKIDLPLPIITNIKKLVQDQNSVQGIIDDMKNTIPSVNTFNDTPEHFYEKQINRRIPNPNPPPPPPPPP